MVPEENKARYPYPLDEADSTIDKNYPGTAVERLTNVLARVQSLKPADLNGDWHNIVRPKLLWAGGLKEDHSTAHAFNDDNHCDLTTMRGLVQDKHNTSGIVAGISDQNFLGDHIRKASLPELGIGGSWSTCTNGAHLVPPHDVAHVQFSSRVAFKLVWCPPTFEKFVLVGDEGELLKIDGGRLPAVGTPTGNSIPHIAYRKCNFDLVAGGLYAKATLEQAFL